MAKLPNSRLTGSPSLSKDMKNWRGSIFAWLVGCLVVWMEHWAETNVTLVSGTVEVIPSFCRVETYFGHTRDISETYVGHIWDIQGDPPFLPPQKCAIIHKKYRFPTWPPLEIIKSSTYHHQKMAESRTGHT